MVKNMKPYKKITALLLAVIMVILAAGCTPISLSKEWSYRMGDNIEYSIGTYSYALYQAYQSAQKYAKNNADYDSAKSFMDLEITDDDGNTATAKDWIKTEADKIMKNLLALDSEMSKANITVDSATMDEAKKNAKNIWDVGQYASYGYYSPMSKELEPYGISFDSFFAGSYAAQVKQNALFTGIYGKDGPKAVSDSDLTDYFKSNYTDYSYFTAALSTSSDSSGTNKTAMTDEEKETLETTLQGYADKINDGSATFKDMVNEYMSANSITTDPSKNAVESLTDSSIGDEIKEKLNSMSAGEAAILEVGTGSSAQCYFLYKDDVNKDVDTYINDDTKRLTV